MNIEVWSEKMSDQLVEKGYVKDIAELFELKMTSVAALDRNGRKMAQKSARLKSKASKNNSRARLNLRARDSFRWGATGPAPCRSFRFATETR